MDTQTIRAEARAESGKGPARKLRSRGFIPAVAYGPGGNSQPLALDPKQLRELRRSPLGWNQPVNIEVDGGTNIEFALLRAVQKHPVTGSLLHADFQQVVANSEVEIRLPLRIEGRARGQEVGGVINQPRRELRVLCIPSMIPQAISIDVSALEIGDKIMLSELALPEGVRAVVKTDMTVVSCVGRRVEALPEDLADEEGEEGAEDGAADGGESSEGGEASDEGSSSDE